MNLGTRKARGKSVDTVKFLAFLQKVVAEGKTKAQAVAEYNATFGVDTSEASFTQKVQNTRDKFEAAYLKKYKDTFDAYKAAGDTDAMEELEKLIEGAILKKVPHFVGGRKNSAENVIKNLIEDFDLPGMDDLKEEV